MLLQIQGDLVQADACVDGIICSTKESESGVFYDFGSDLSCSTVAWPAARRRAFKICPGTTPRCFGGRIGFGAVAGSLIQSGPCLGEPQCSAEGKFTVYHNTKRGSFKHDFIMTEFLLCIAI